MISNDAAAGLAVLNVLVSGVIFLVSIGVAVVIFVLVLMIQSNTRRTRDELTQANQTLSTIAKALQHRSQ